MRAIVASSGASTMLMKSKWPSVAHCALTVAPSCSTSRLTSRMRAGLFFTVWMPSGVSVESMMYVGMSEPSHLRRPVAVALVALLAGAAPAAAAPRLRNTLKPCYVSVDRFTREPVAIDADGFTPGAKVQVSVDGVPEATPTADPNGVITGQVSAP